METQTEPRRAVPPRLPPVAIGFPDEDDGNEECPHCHKMIKKEWLVLHIQTEHEE